MSNSTRYTAADTAAETETATGARARNPRAHGTPAYATHKGTSAGRIETLSRKAARAHKRAAYGSAGAYTAPAPHYA